jgi:hypothetical protein
MVLSPGGLENLQTGHDCTSSSNDRHNVETERNRIFTLILELLEYSHRVPAVRIVLDAIALPEAEGAATLTSVLESIVSNDGETMFMVQGLDKALDKALVTLSEQNLHFHAQPSGARKRKRDELEAQEETGIPRNDIEDVIHAALTSLQNNKIDTALLTTLQLHLHTIFVSSVSSLTPSTPMSVRNTLSKMSKLIQLLGVLSNLQLPIIPIPVQTTLQSTEIMTDIGADTSNPSKPTPTIHPCPHPTCLKTFQKAYDLRVHSRVHVNHRPFTCHSCPATFTRSHDLQRHVRTHPGLHANLDSSTNGSMGRDTGTSVLVTPAVRCTVCQKFFSRRDAFLRHTRGGKGKDGKDRNSDNPPRCAAALGENVANLPSPSTSKRKRTNRWDKSRADPLQATEVVQFQATDLGTLDQHSTSLQSDPNDPFSIFSEMDFAQMEMDLGQLLGLPQFIEHIPDIEL